MAGNGDQAQAVSWAPLIYTSRCKLSFPGSFVQAALHSNLLKPTGFGGGGGPTLIFAQKRFGDDSRPCIVA